MKTKDEIPKLIQDVIYGQDHRLLDDDIGRAATHLLQHGVVDDLVRSLIQTPVRRHKINQAFIGPFELPALTHGDLVLGIDMRGKPIRIPSQYFNGHSLTVGGSGSGKTTMSKFLVMQIAGNVEGLWCLDFVKREFAMLKPYLARLGINLLVIPARELKLNPLQCPEHVAPTDWAPRIADILVNILQLPARATKLIHLTILKLYPEFGISDGVQHYPTLFDLREAVANNPIANHQAKQAIVDSLDPVLMSIGSVLRYRVGWNTCDLARLKIVFEFNGIAETDKSLLLSCLILSEFTSRVAQGISNPVMDLFICCDEAARLVSSANQAGGIADLIGLVRGTGIGLDLSVQSSDIANEILSNTSSKFISRCGSARDFDTISGAMGLNHEQRIWLNTNLKPGLFVGQVGEGYWRRPFVFKIPQMNLRALGERVIRDENDLKELMALPTVMAEEFVNWPSMGASAASGSSASKTTSTPEDKLSDAEIRYIFAVVDNPGSPSSALPKLAQISARRAQHIRLHLVELGYLREHKISTGKRGRLAVVLEPLEPALEAVSKMTKGQT